MTLLTLRRRGTDFRTPENRLPQASAAAPEAA